MHHLHAGRLLDVQQRIISLIALGGQWAECLELIATEIERLIPREDAYCSILFLDGKHLRHGAAPSISKEYSEAIDGAEIGPNVGSCGTAAYTAKNVNVSSIETDPLWADYKGLALGAGLRACWSVPIMASYGSVLGSFAIYFGHECEYDADLVDLIERFSHLAGLVLEKKINEGKSSQLHKALQHNSHRFESFARAMPDLVLVFDEDGYYVDIYGGEMKSLVLPANMLLGQKLSDILPPAISTAMLNVIHECLDQQKRMVYEYELDVQTGNRIFEARVSPIPVYDLDQPEKGHVIWVAQDVSERRKADDTIRKLSFYDSVTSLPNRRLLKERLGMQARKANSKGLFGAILYVDLIDFKRVNDSVGMSGGDALVVAISKRIGAVLDHRDSLARIGGDDFVILLDAMSDSLKTLTRDTTSIATKVLSVFDKHFKVADKLLRVSARVGINVFGGENVVPEKLINQAESAMYRAKELNERVVFFDETIQKNLIEQLHLEYDLEHALNNEEVTVYYQPQVDKTGRVKGFEALMRWEHPEKGFISPVEFIPLAEKLDIMPQLQELVFRHVCSVVKVMERDESIAENFRIAVNISACQFIKDDFEKAVTSVLSRYEVSPERITIEITEGTLLTEIDVAMRQMKRLQSLGFDLSIDDFGTGYSSLAYLQKLPVNEIKIDKRFVDELEHSDAGRSIVDVIIYLAKQLSCRIVAEGVEIESQLR
ncbi:hypothetical protein A3715_36510, partial [Oleiphilus sp. HI0009]